MAELEKCVECGKVMKDDTHAPYCKACDDKLDKQFDTIEDNVLIFKELLDSEIEILKKFETEDIEEFFKRVYKKFKDDGNLNNESLIVLNKLKSSFNLTESKMGLPQITVIKETKEDKLLKNNQCPGCEKGVQKDFNLCPYCGYRINKDFNSKY
jgi:predicted amidophosphoribosyltransferase